MMGSTILLAVGRVLLGALFVMSGWSNLRSFSATAGGMRKRAVIAAPFLLGASIVFRIVVGSVFALGRLQAVSALALAAFTLAASAMMLDFWSMEGPQRAAAINSWKSNLAIVGGLLIAATL